MEAPLTSRQPQEHPARTPRTQMEDRWFCPERISVRWEQPRGPRWPIQILGKICVTFFLDKIPPYLCPERQNILLHFVQILEDQVALPQLASSLKSCQEPREECWRPSGWWESPRSRSRWQPRLPLARSSTWWSGLIHGGRRIPQEGR